MGTRVSQFSSLLSGYVDPNTGLVGAGYTVYFYAAGTTTAKDVWTAYDKTGGAVTSAVLDATGSALVFGDGVYKLVIKNLASATVDTFDGVKTQFSGYDVTTSTAATLAVTTDMDAVLLDCTSTNQVVTLPLASASTRPIFFKRISAGSNTITIVPTSPNTIDGAASTSLATLNTDVTLVSDGANWYGQASATTNADTLSGYSIGSAVNTIPLRSTDGYIAGAVPAASATVAGISELATDAEAVTGTATDRVVTPANLAARESARRFTSSAFTLAANTIISYNHGFGQVPWNTFFKMVCLETEHGYAVGDVCYQPYLITGQADVTAPIPVRADATKVYFCPGEATVYVQTQVASSAADYALATAAKWSCYLCAEK